MNGISGMYGYPNPFQVVANPTGAGATNLNADYAKDFGLGLGNVYNLPLDVTMGFGAPGADCFTSSAAGGMMNPYMMNPYMMMNPYVMQSMMMSPAYKDYLNLDFKDRLTYDADLRSSAREIDYNERKDAMRYAAAGDGLTAAINEACISLQTVIKEGESDQIMKQYEGLVNMIRNSAVYTRMKEEYKDDTAGLEKALSNFARYQFQAATGQDLKAMIQENCDSALANSFWNTVSFGNAQTYSSEDIIAKMEGSQTPKSVKTKKTVGKVGGVTATTATGAAVGCIAGPVGAMVGAGIGFVAGMIGSFM